MKYHQSDIVEVNFLFPDGTFKPHPALIVSNDELQEDEGFIYMCMISSKAYNQQYNCNIERDVIRKISKLKQPYFDEVVEKIKRTIF